MTVEPTPELASVIRQGLVLATTREADKTACHFSDGSSLIVSNILAAHIRPGDEIIFPLAIDFPGGRTEISISKAPSARGDHDLYQAPISYVGQPKADKRGQFYVRAEVSTGRLGISSIHLPCGVVRDYFYSPARDEPWMHRSSFYDILRITPSASLAELRVNIPRQSRGL